MKAQTFCVLVVVAIAVGVVASELDGVAVGADGTQKTIKHADFDEVHDTASTNKHTPAYNCEEVRLGHARFQVLTSRIIRLEFADDGAGFNDKATFVVINRNVDCVEFTHAINDGILTIKTEYLELTYSGKGQSGSGGFTADNTKIVISGPSLPHNKPVVWVPGTENTNQMFGTIRTLDRVSGAFSLDCKSLPPRSAVWYSPVAQHCTYGIVSRNGWVVVDDTESPVFDNSPWPWVQQGHTKPTSNSQTRQDWYMLGHGLDYKAALRDFSKISGNQPIPPRFSFGVFYSRWWPWADWESMKIIKEYEEYSVPLDVLVTDMDWHKTCYREQDMGYVDLAGQPACWTGWTWDPKYFPDPRSFMDWCKKHGIKNTLNLHLASGVQPWEKQFVEIAHAMDLDPTKKGTYVEWNVTDKKFSHFFHKHVLGPMEDEGVDFWWLDWQQGEGWFKDTFPNVNPTFYLNYVFFTQPARWANGERPLILHRWGGLGNHRYPVGFSGDVYPNWASLEYQPYMTRESANVLFGYWSHDIGGFMEPAADELYLRWIQYGVFSPIFRTHGTRLAENIKRMWHYKPEYFKAMRSAMQLRAKMLPYIYTAARHAFDTGESICSPLYYDHPTLEAAYGHPTQYKFGQDMFVAPVVSAVYNLTQLADVKVWVPPGQWFEFFTARVFEGGSEGKEIKRYVALTEIPVFVRAGSIVVMKLIGFDEEALTLMKGGKLRSRDGAQQTNNYRWLGRSADAYEGLDVNLYLPLDVSSEQEFETTHYDDDGSSVGYLEGHFSWRKISYKISSNHLSVQIGKPSTVFPGSSPVHWYRLTIHSAIPPLAITANGHNVKYQPWVTFDPSTDENTWSYDGNGVALVVNLFNPVAYDEEIAVEIQFGKHSETRVAFTNEIRAKLAGLRGRIARAQIAKHTLDSSYPETVPSDYEKLTLYAETGMRLSYQPDTFPQEIEVEAARFLEAVEHGSQFTKGFKRKQSVGLNKVASAHLNKL